MGAFLLFVSKNYPLIFQATSLILLVSVVLFVLFSIYSFYYVYFVTMEPGETRQYIWLKRSFDVKQVPLATQQVKELKITQLAEEPSLETNTVPEGAILEALGLKNEGDTKDELTVDESNLGYKTIQEGNFAQGYEILKKGKFGEKETPEDRCLLLAREAFHEYMDNENKKALDELRNLFRENIDLEDVQNRYSLALALCANTDFDLALVYVDESIALLKTKEGRAHFIAAKAGILERIGVAEESIDLLKAEIPNFQKPVYLSKLYQKLGDIYFSLEGENSLMGILCLKAAVNYGQHDQFKIFNLANKLGIQGKHAQALHYYQMIEKEFYNSKAAFNNAGVSANKLGLKITTVKNYQKAIDEGETLAVANLANLLMARGFHEKAEKMLKEAHKVEGYHKNIDSALVALEGEKEVELEKKNNILKDVSLLNSKNIEYAKALIKKDFDFSSLVGEYTGKPKGLKIFKDDSGDLKGKVIESVDAGIALKSLLNSMGEEIVKNTNFNFFGEGDLLWFTWEVPKPDSQSSFAIGIKDHGSGCLLIKDSGNTLEGYLSNELKPAKEFIEWKLTKPD